MYTQKSEFAQAIGTLGPNVVTGTGVMAHRYLINRQCVVRRIGYIVTTASTVTPTVINVELRPTPGSAAGDSVIGTITIPITGAGIGTYVYKEVAGVVAAPGSEIAWNVTTASTAGGGLPVMVCEYDPEVPANVSAMLASA